MNEYSELFNRPLGDGVFPHPDRLLKIKPNPRHLTPPKEVQKQYTFTYDQLHCFLRMFGTHVAVGAQGLVRSGMTAHTDVVVYPAVNSYMQEAEEYVK